MTAAVAWAGQTLLPPAAVSFMLTATIPRLFNI
jgi:hypothetical protein